MKKLLLQSVIICVAFVVKCHAQLLQKMIEFPGTPSERHWNFNAVGQLTDIRHANDAVIADFTYDTNGNMVTWNIYETTGPFMAGNHIFTYDTNNRIASYNGIPVTFDPVTNLYTYTIYGNNGYSEAYYYTVNLEGLIVAESRTFTFAPDDIDYDGGISAGLYLNGNLVRLYAGNANWQGNWTHVTIDNPLRPQLLPNIRAALFTHFDSPSGKMAGAEFASGQLESRQDYGLFDPDTDEFYYELNAQGKPQVKHRRYYYFDDLESDYVSAIYYYQGDTIPD
ncbi:hypothetical protein FLLO111716_01365 [Flavobacterium longum]|uniref:hypothetical protein n=1 Tax=Flavobacterium longum TaxID=1299340 RepID=UPI0039ED03CE